MVGAGEKDENPPRPVPVDEEEEDDDEGGMVVAAGGGLEEEEEEPHDGVDTGAARPFALTLKSGVSGSDAKLK